MRFGGLLVLLPLAAACGVHLDSAGGLDASTRATADAPVAIDGSTTSLLDAAPDAAPRPCTGGNAQVTAGTACFVYTATATTWTDAGTACTAMMAHLAIVDSATTNATITTLVGTNDVFLGGTDAATEGTWLWTDNTPIALTGTMPFQNWRSGEPNNGAGGHEEDCLVLEGSKTPAGTWDDRPCAPEATTTTPGRYGYVCQY
jgi:hypothetical protein